MAGSVIGTFTAPATDLAVLKSFYSTVRPWGAWDNIKELVIADDPAFAPNKNFKLNMFNVVIGTIAQLCLTILPMYLILMQKLPLLVTVALLAVIIIILNHA
jgi:SSS family solute:Na+ symporter